MDSFILHMDLFLFGTIMAVFLGICSTQPEYSLYIRTDNPKSWQEAQMECEKIGLKLVKIETEEKHNKIFEILRKYYSDYEHEFWIGFRSENTPFRWHDGTCSQYNPIGQHTGTSLCVLLYLPFGDRWAYNLCEKEFAYICENEEKDWEYEFDDITVEITSEKTWRQSQAACESQGSTLVKIDSLNKQSFIANILSEQYPSFQNGLWIGLRAQVRPEPERSQWRWPDGTHAQWTGWVNTSHLSGDQAKCGMILPPYQYRWVDNGCRNKHGYICEKKKYNISIVTEVTETWPSAQSACRAQGMNLIKIDSKHKNNYVITLLETYHKRNNDTYWIGYYASGHPGKLVGHWEWYDGQCAQWTNWQNKPSAQPSGDRHQRAGINPAYGYRWESRPDSQKHAYICEGQSDSEDEQDNEHPQTITNGRNCSNIPPPVNGWLKNIGRKLVVGCNYSNQTWFLSCYHAQHIERIKCNSHGTFSGFLIGTVFTIVLISIIVIVGLVIVIIKYRKRNEALKKVSWLPTTEQGRAMKSGSVSSLYAEIPHEYDLPSHQQRPLPSIPGQHGDKQLSPISGKTSQGSMDGYYLHPTANSIASDVIKKEKENEYRKENERNENDEKDYLQLLAPEEGYMEPKPPLETVRYVKS